MKYFIPWWDDYVNLDYDFETDRPKNDVKVTMHHLYDNPPYDGILVSKTKIEENKSNMRKIAEHGIHEYLEFQGPVFGDCGAYGYINESSPPFSPTEIARYYDQLGFDFGVSVDHLIVKAVEDQKHERYELTLKNAEKFLHEYEAKGYDYIPVGAAQGWSPVSYKEAVESLLDMGYTYIAIGGLTRSQTPDILRVLRAVHEVLKQSQSRIGVHLFGVARLNTMLEFCKSGVTSFDSASHLRRAWLGASSNYILPNGKGYAALRVPQSDRSPRVKQILAKGHVTLEELEEMDQACMNLIRMYGQNKADLDEVLEGVLWYDSVMGDKRNHADAYQATLQDRPWESCSCTICRDIGIEVIIFRGNNRNRRRGFHNTKVFYDCLQELLERGEKENEQTKLEDF
jgi:hypothetical protein